MSTAEHPHIPHPLPGPVVGGADHPHRHHALHARLDDDGALVALGAACRTLAGAPHAPIASASDALERLRLAAAAGHPAAYWLLGEAHEKGEGIPRDVDAAVSFYRAAAALDFRPALDALRRLHVSFHKPARRHASVALDAANDADDTLSEQRFIKPPFADDFTYSWHELSPLEKAQRRAVAAATAVEISDDLAAAAATAASARECARNMERSRFY